MKYLPLAWALVLMAATLGCALPPAVTKNHCKSSSDCEAGYRCDMGTCAVNLTMGMAGPYGVTAIAGEPISPAPVVVFKTDAGDTATTYDDVVQVGVVGNLATLDGNTKVHVVGGMATFEGLRMTAAGQYVLQFDAVRTTSALSVPIEIKAGPATQLRFIKQPETTLIASNLAATVAYTDAFGNIDPNSTQVIAISLASNPDAATASGIRSMTPTAGQAEFLQLIVNTAGTGYVLHANGGAFTADSIPFTIRQPAWAKTATHHYVSTVASDGTGDVFMAATDDPTTHQRTPDGGITTTASGSYEVTLQDPHNPNVLFGQNEAVAGPLVQSTDGGTTWAVSAIPANAYKIAIDPRSSSTVYYIEYLDIGWFVHKTVDSGATWTTILEPQARLVAIAISPTGTLHILAESSVYTSSDGGNSWARANAAGSGTATGIALDTASGAIYVASTDGIYRSSDDGMTWKQVSSEPASQVAVLATSPPTVYAVLSRDRYYRGILASTDAGVSWFRADWGLPTSVVRMELFVVPGHPEVLYACPDRDSIYKTASGGF